MKAPLLIQSICEIRFNPTFNFHKKRFELCEKFLKKLPYWNINWKIIELFNTKNREDSSQLFALTNHGASFSDKKIQNYEEFVNLSFHFMKITEINLVFNSW